MGSPDALTPVGGATTALDYPGFAAAAAAIRYDGSAGGGKVVFMGFPFETITASAVRSAYIADILKDFSRRPIINSVGVTNGAVQVSSTGEPGLTYQFESSTNLLIWAPAGTVATPDGTVAFAEPLGTDSRRFYRVRTAATP